MAAAAAGDPGAKPAAAAAGAGAASPEACARSGRRQAAGRDRHPRAAGPDRGPRRRRGESRCPASTPSAGCPTGARAPAAIRACGGRGGDATAEARRRRARERGGARRQGRQTAAPQSDLADLADLADRARSRALGRRLGPRPPGRAEERPAAGCASVRPAAARRQSANDRAVARVGSPSWVGAAARGKGGTGRPFRGVARGPVCGPGARGRRAVAGATPRRSGRIYGHRPGRQSAPGHAAPGAACARDGARTRQPRRPQQPTAAHGPGRTQDRSRALAAGTLGSASVRAAVPARANPAVPAGATVGAGATTASRARRAWQTRAPLWGAVPWSRRRHRCGLGRALSLV